jgi:predicted Zn finger-like uncharacterized protein
VRVRPDRYDPASLAKNAIDTMSERQDPSFTCKNCGAHYKVVRVEEPSTMNDREVTCVNCDAALQARDDRFVLKYFLVATQGRPKRSPRRNQLDKLLIERERRGRGGVGLKPEVR